MRHRLTISLLCAASMSLLACESKTVEPKKETPATKPNAKPSNPSFPTRSNSAVAPESAPADTKPADTKPADTKPADVKPADKGADEKPGAPITREDGLVIEDLKIGTGPAVPKGTCVIINYRGTLKSDGSEFDSTYKRNEPAAYPLPRLVQGWQEGIPGMKVGGKRKLIVPAALGYGDEGRPPVIPPKADLVFEIELLNFMQIEDLKVGDGAEVKSRNQTVRVYYKGTFLSDGKEFQSNFGGEPIEFNLGRVIPGWSYGLIGMKVGGTRKLTIPTQFAYGAEGRPEIPPNADLVFEIQMLDVK